MKFMVRSKDSRSQHGLFCEKARVKKYETASEKKQKREKNAAKCFN